MSIASTTDTPLPSTRPYLIRALHDWCTENGFTPYLAVAVDASTQVPLEYVRNQEIVLNVSFDATSHLRLGNDWIEFNARFGGVAREIMVPVDHVIAIYAKENGQGMAFPMPTPAEVPVEKSPTLGLAPALTPQGSGPDEPPSSPSPQGGARRPTLTRVK
jgi:stringent starvation protein B